MHYDATLRVRELTQNIYDIGDEIAEHIDNVSQAMADWDHELVVDCMHELQDVVADGRPEARAGLAELNGLRQAFVSGVRAGSMSNHSTAFAHPGRTLSFLHKHPTAPTLARSTDTHDTEAGSLNCIPRPQAMASTNTWRVWLRQRNETLIGYLTEVSEWVINQTKVALESQAVLLPQSFAQALKATDDVVGEWADMIATQPALAASMRGESPPHFLVERARVDAIISKLLRRRESVG